MGHRIAIIGAGDVVRKAYLPVLLRRADCEIVAISSQEGQSARELASLYKIDTVCEGYEEIVQQDGIDTIFICTPTYLHREIAEAAMEYGKNVLIEKPLCTDYRDSHILLEQAHSYSKTIYVAFNNQFREENQWLRSEVLAGAIGNIELIELQWYRTKRYEHKAWLYDQALSGGGVLIDLGAHMIYFALSLIAERVRFTAYCSNASYNPLHSSVEDTSMAIITVNERVMILLKLGWAMKLSMKSRVTLEIFGSGGSISNQEYKGEKTDGFENMIGDFIHHIEAGTNPDLGLVDDTMKLLMALYESSRSRSVIGGEF